MTDTQAMRTGAEQLAYERSTVTPMRGIIVDGTRMSRYTGDVGIRDGRIPGKLLRHSGAT